jgi:predicted enzyme related to lactoylglutathione lyase
MNAAVVRWQIVTPHAEQSAGFYKQLFGWKVDQRNGLGYRELVSSSDRGINGGVWPAPPDAPSFVQLFIEVPDVDASIAAALKLGAAIIVPKSVLPDGDEMAVLRDPTGVTFGLCLLRPDR